MIQRPAECLELVGHVSHADAQLHTATAHLIEDGHLFREAKRVIERGGTKKNIICCQVFGD